MITFTNLTGLASIVILIAAAAVLLFRAIRIPQRYWTGLTFVVAVIVCIPWNGLPPAAYVRGVTGDLSITSILLLILTLMKFLKGWQPFKNREKVLFWGLIVLAAIALYPLALGTGYIDPYRWGFGNVWFLVGLFVIAFATYLKRFYVIATCIALAVFAWSVGWNEATNLWNYLLDPFVVVYAIGALMTVGVRAIVKWRRGYLQ